MGDSAQPLTARVATNGPTGRPTWYLWKAAASWILTGCDLDTGLVRLS